MLLLKLRLRMGCTVPFVVMLYTERKSMELITEMSF